MDFWLALIIIVAVMGGLIVAAALIYKALSEKQKSDSSKSLPKGADNSDFGKLLQDKYRTERDNGNFQRPDLF